MEAYRRVRARTEDLCRPLAIEDYVVQSMPDVSPTRWHIAHTSWFFETFVLTPGLEAYRPFREEFKFLFNSYYNSVGPMHGQPDRGLMTRPTVEEITEYRAHVDRGMETLLSSAGEDQVARYSPVIVLGLNHAQQHQELLLTDIKHVFFQNPLYPIYRDLNPGREAEVAELGWILYPEGLREIGHSGDGFGYDNETPRHRVFVDPFRLADRLITNGEYLEFMEAGGYDTPTPWLSDGWYAVKENGWNAPLYWVRKDGGWHEFTLGGLREVRPTEPVAHLSLYEADAFARWAGARLATEAEWEVAAEDVSLVGNLLETDHLHPIPLVEPAAGRPRQLFGDVWEWTRSAYQPYPGYKPVEGALGEYNGKFMSSQMVLKGGSCLTPGTHIRKTYRNFYPPNARWQVTGLRLAKDE